MDDDKFILDDLLAMMADADITSVSLHSIVSEHPESIGRLRDFNPVTTASIFGGLLTVPDLQSNCIRLETLVHIALALGSFDRDPDLAIVADIFSTLGDGVCGRCEDPAEDLFVSLVETPRGNFRILEGTWESASFYLQVFVDAIERMPRNSDYYDSLRDSVYSLLLLSDVVCERAGLLRYQLGSAIPETSINSQIAERLSSIGELVHFSESDLTLLDLSLKSLSAFGFIPDFRAKLIDESIGNSSLERSPLLYWNDEIYLALPTAVSSAIRRFVIEQMDASGMREAFIVGLSHEYARRFAKVPLFGGRIGAPIQFMRTPRCILAGVIMPVERGRFLSFVFVLDTLEAFEKRGLAGYNPTSQELEENVRAWLEHSYKVAREDPDFRDGVTLLVPCGVGRGFAFSLEEPDWPNWRIELISAADLYTLSWADRIGPLTLWRVFEAVEKLGALGVALQNVNGLINLFSWMRSLNGHIVPHASLPDDFANEAKAFVQISQNALRDIRYEVATTHDPHVELDTAGNWITVRRDTSSSFDEDLRRPLYVSIEDRKDGGARSVYVAPNRRWWVEIETPQAASGQSNYQRWRMVTTWLARAAPVLDMTFTGLPKGPILWRMQFGEPLDALDENSEMMSYAETRAQLSFSAAPGGNTLTLVAEPAFDAAHYNEENIAELAMVETLIDAMEVASGQILDARKRAEIILSIVPNSSARETHMFRTQGFRDHIRSWLPKLPTRIDEIDAATLKLGLGWGARDRREGSYLRGKQACMAYLNDLVKHAEDELCGELHKFDRTNIILAMLQSHEKAAVERNRWSRTAAAVIALRNDSEAAMTKIAEHDFELNAVFQSTRLLSEIAICECPSSGGAAPSSSDVSKLMARMAIIQQLGGWSDAIRWDVMEPYIRITALGDVYAQQDFLDEIVAPFAKVASDARTKQAIDDYASNLARPEEYKSAKQVLEPAFLEAWLDETGAELDDFRLFVEFVENIAIQQETAVLLIPKSRLEHVTVEQRSLSSETVNAIVEFLTFKSRLTWKTLPTEFDDSDRQPWKFRRRLSLLRRPLLQVNDEEDPTLIVAPGILRESLTYMVRNYYEGDFPLRQLKKRMRVWTGAQSDRTGHRFGAEVSERLLQLGWKTEVEVKVTKLLRQGFDRDYGDVDVLAWDEKTGRVLIIECKDLQYRKTYGEIAEQLADFRGDIGMDGKRDDLRKHLDRVDLISDHMSAVTNFLKLGPAIRLESHLVFRNPVPVEFALKHMTDRVSVCTLDRLNAI
ncbi:hypothetical protein [Dongia sedimenti]|uniref:Restriction endonuclease type IV Mrr domain-containing protein n=1 Tax=Dongia sedimenti TaxID=3064282 RepID=A0ABU0YLK1_9PROT|nr:hypothetical protein [Rhodospirillaceae bacterium R-7]